MINTLVLKCRSRKQKSHSPRGSSHIQLHGSRRGKGSPFGSPVFVQGSPFGSRELPRTATQNTTELKSFPRSCTDEATDAIQSGGSSSSSGARDLVGIQDRLRHRVGNLSAGCSAVVHIIYIGMLFKAFECSIQEGGSRLTPNRLQMNVFLSQKFPA